MVNLLWLKTNIRRQFLWPFRNFHWQDLWLLQVFIARSFDFTDLHCQVLWLHRSSLPGPLTSQIFIARFFDFRNLHCQVVLWFLKSSLPGPLTFEIFIARYFDFPSKWACTDLLRFSIVLDCIDSTHGFIIGFIIVSLSILICLWHPHARTKKTKQIPYCNCAYATVVVWLSIHAASLHVCIGTVTPPKLPLMCDAMCAHFRYIDMVCKCHFAEGIVPFSKRVAHSICCEICLSDVRSRTIQSCIYRFALRLCGLLYICIYRYI